MPSPIGHALAGVAVALAFRGSSWQMLAVCALCAALPDIDLVYMPTHRTATHSLPIAIVGTIVAVAVTGWVKPSAWRVALACGIAWASHMLLDWLGADANPPQGIQALWPFSDAWFHAGLDLFPGTERRHPLSARAMLINLRAAAQEIVIMGVVVAIIWAGRAGRAGEAGRAGRSKSRRA
jgi:membrane-bound metal-dependent hydrolase YbcI (DUF457 family)